MDTATNTTRAGSEFTTGCCPRFDSAPWDQQEIDWTAKPFVREHVRSFMHVPLNMGRRVTHALARIDAAHAKPRQQLMLADETSRWRSELYIAVTKDVPGTEMAHLSGKYLTKVFEGPFRDAPKWAQEMTRFVEGRGYAVRRMYFGYTTCPACAKAYGKNYVVMVAQISGDSPQQAFVS